LTVAATPIPDVARTDIDRRWRAIRYLAPSMKKTKLKVTKSSILEMTPSQTKAVAGGINNNSAYPCLSYDICTARHCSALC